MTEPSYSLGRFFLLAACMALLALSFLLMWGDEPRPLVVKAGSTSEPVIYEGEP